MKIMIGGAALDSGNLGLSALCHSMAASLKERLPDAQILISDNGDGVRNFTLASDSGSYDVLLVGLRDGKKVWRQENVVNVKFWKRLGINGSDVVNAIRNVDVFLDISGGDSFTDLYGLRRFELVNFPKKLFSELGVPMIFMPQTYGPFKMESVKTQAGLYVRNSVMAWARDERSFEILKDLAGQDFKEGKYKSGVDMAFLLPVDSDMSDVNNEVVELALKGEAVGINVSGLIFNSPENAKSKYGFKADYHEALKRIVTSLVRDENVDVVLLSHVQTPIGHYESDLNACVECRNLLEDDVKDKVHILPDILNEVKIKKVISSFSWFMGTRMHATIAALSTATPVVTISYSDKAKGVFESCGVGDYVYDPRVLETDMVVESVLRSFKERTVIKRLLDEHLPSVKLKANGQMNEIVEKIQLCDNVG